MKNFILKSIFLIVLLCCSVDIAAFFKVDGITYDIVSDTDLTVSVTYDQNSYYSGDIVIPESVQYEGKTYRVVAIGYLAFESCWGLRSLSLPEGILKIGNNAFSGCTSLESLVLPRTVEEIGEYAFQGCNELISFTFSESLKYVGQNAFEGCVKLEEVNVQDVNTLLNIEYVNEKSNPLYFAHNLKSEEILVTSFVMTDSVNVIKPYAFCGCTSLQNIDFGKKIKTIGKYAFDGCNGLKKITVPNNVEVIQDWAFRFCMNLEAVVLGENLRELGNGVFAENGKIETIIVKSIDVPDYNLSIWDPIDPFMENVYSDAVLTVPAESIDAYKSSKYWGKFHNIIADCSHMEDFGYDKISIKVIKGNIVIEGSDDMIKTVYNADGQIVYKGIDQTIEVGSSGIYIIRIEGCARKVIL